MNYLLSGTEYAIPGSLLMFQQLLNDLEHLDGIVLRVSSNYENEKTRLEVYQQ